MLTTPMPTLTTRDRTSTMDQPQIDAAIPAIKSGRLCSMDGCEKPAQWLGMCRPHYYQQKRRDSPDTKPGGQRKGFGNMHPAGCVRTMIDGDIQFDHIRIAEKALGRPLPEGAQVHHVDENPSNNEPSNLVVCPDQAYHRLLHVRMRALDACGHANWRKCRFCKTFDAPGNLSIRVGGVHHTKCNTEYYRKRRGQNERSKR